MPQWTLAPGTLAWALPDTATSQFSPSLFLNLPSLETPLFRRDCALLL